MNSDKIVTRYDTYLIKISYFFKQCQNALYKKKMLQKNSYQLIEACQIFQIAILQTLFI